MSEGGSGGGGERGKRENERYTNSVCQAIQFPSGSSLPPPLLNTPFLSFFPSLPKYSGSMSTTPSATKNFSLLSPHTLAQRSIMNSTAANFLLLYPRNYPANIPAL